MWLMPKPQNKLVTISCTPTTLACAWLQASEKTATYDLKGYKRITLSDASHNPISIEKHVTSFLAKHKLEDACLSIGLRNPRVYENIIDLPTASPDPADILLPKKQQH